MNFDERCQTNSYDCLCICSNILPQHIDCYIKNRTILRPTWIWIGYINDPYKKDQSLVKYLTFHRCSFDYCSHNETVISTRKSLTQDSQCQFNRTGILCGACGQNLSLILGSSECWSCSSEYLLLVFAFILLGALLIIFLSIFNLTISDSKMSGFIFYANIVHINGIIYIPSQKKVLSNVLKIVMAWINLDLGIKTCFYSGMDAYAKAWLQFAFPLYLWILSGLIVFLCNRYISVTRLFGTNSVRVLATVILLSFTKLLRAVVIALSWVKLRIHQNGASLTRLLWASDANIPYLQGKHIPLFTFGLLISVVWLIFIVFVLFIQCWPRLRCCSRIQRLKPFTDSFTGPNTSHGRFWTGLLLFSRLLIAVGYELYRNSEIIKNYFYFVALVSVGLLLVLAFLPSGVYNQHYSNFLETFFLLNLLFISLDSANDPTTVSSKYASVSLALIVFIGILVYHCWTQVKCTRCAALHKSL